MSPDFERAVHLEACWRQRSLIVGYHPNLSKYRAAFLRVHDDLCPNWEVGLEEMLTNVYVDAINRQERVIEPVRCETDLRQEIRGILEEYVRAQDVDEALRKIMKQADRAVWPDWDDDY